MNAENRFWRKVKKTETCWLWTGCTGKNGYGFFIDENGKQVYAHRWAWERYKGKIPTNWEIHHNKTCPKNCVNYESHLTPLTKKDHRRLEPSIRKDNKCWMGHEITDKNTYVDGKGYKLCRSCRRIASTSSSRRRRKRDRSKG